MIQNPAVSDNDTLTFPLVSAEACTCCGRELSQGYTVPYIGVVGPKCVRKFAPLAYALAQVESLTLAVDAPVETKNAFWSLRYTLLMGIGFEVDRVQNADGSWTLKIGARTHTHTSVVKSWKERREEFARELLLAGAQLEAAPVEEVEVLTLEALTAMTAAQRRAVAVEHGVLTPTGKASTSVTLIWAAVQLAQAAEAQAVAEVAPLGPMLVLENPVTGPAFLPYAVGPFQQIEQQQAQRMAESTPTRLERLSRLHFLCVVSELSADPCTPERAARGHRADQVALAYRAERAKAAHTEPCGVCGRPGRAETGLCPGCQDSWDRETAERAVWAGAVHLVGPRQQVEQQHFAQAPTVMVRCAECEPEGRALYDVGREHDGTPIEARLTCEVCHGDGKVPVPCPECLGEGVALVESDFSFKYRWCLKCALEAIEHGDRYMAKQVAEIRAQAVAAGLLVPQPQPEQQQAQALTDAEWERQMEAELDAQDALEAARNLMTGSRRPLTEHEQEERWRQDDLMERRAAFLREDY